MEAEMVMADKKHEKFLTVAPFDHKKFLTVAPFECAWRQELRFKEAGRGCVSFEAFAHNDVTVVFREHVGSQQYHYKKDSSPHYTVILGSHRNKRLKIEVDGNTVVDVEGIGLCSSSAFQRYWICIYDGLISIGKGRYPFQNLVFQWLDSNPNCSVQYVGLSSWDKHVGYRNVSVLPLTHNHISLWRQVDRCEYNGEEDRGKDFDESTGEDVWGLEVFLESWELSDTFFVAGEEGKLVPAHKVVLAASGNFNFGASGEDAIQLRGFNYHTLHAFLLYIYTGKTQILTSELSSLRDLSSLFEVMPLVKQCDELIEHFKMKKKLFDSRQSVEISYPSSQSLCCTAFPSKLPVSVKRLKQFYSTGEYSDIDIYVEGCDSVFRSHKILISLWSAPFFKMFTNGMSETASGSVCLRQVAPEAFNVMLEYMYSGELNLEDSMDNGNLLLQLLLLGDQFGITPLQQECCKIFLECLSEDSVCPILQVASSIHSCKVIEESCKRKFATHFDYCTTANLDFIILDEATFRSILQHPDLTVTSEERILNAILLWCMQAKELCGWDFVDELLKHSTLDEVFGQRLKAIKSLLPLVQFSLMQYELLKKLEKTSLMGSVPVFTDLVQKAIDYMESGQARADIDQISKAIAFDDMAVKEGILADIISTPYHCSPRFHHRKSSFKELQYICNGDSNGLLYFAGTSYGEHPFVNPVLSKRVTITASSPISRFTDPKVLASKTYQGTSFAGPRIEDGRNCSWWMVDIGEDHQLMCNYYTLRQDGSSCFIRHWNLQGSMDGKTWTNLRVHENDQTICKPAQFASWPVTGSHALLPFRFFRVILTGPTTDFTDPWNFCICFIELYGYFH